VPRPAPPAHVVVPDMRRGCVRGTEVVSDGPADPITTMLEAALSVHELFLAYQQAGFTEPQAFALVQTIITSMGRT
jgi:hypothetical protein